METTKDAKVEPVDMKLEIVVLGVSDVDRAKAFYEKLGWRLDADFTKGDDFRVIQFTPHNSECSIIFGKGVTSAKSGLMKSLTLAVDDIEAARNDLIERGIKVSEVFHFAGGPFNDAIRNARLSGRDLLAAITMATIYNAPVAMGPTYWIPAFWVPLLLVTHYVTFVLLRRPWGS